MRDFERAGRGGREQGTAWWRWLPAAVAQGDEAERSCSGPRAATRSIRDRGKKWLALVGIEQRRLGLGLEEGGGRGDLEVVGGEQWLGKDGSQGGFWREWRRRTGNGGWDRIPRF